MVVLASQYGENTAVSSSFPADGLHAWGIFPVAVFNFTVDDFFNEKSIDKSSFHVWWCGPLSFFVHYMKSSFEELLRDLQIISKELFLSSWNLVSTTNLNTALFYQ